MSRNQMGRKAAAQAVRSVIEQLETRKLFAVGVGSEPALLIGDTGGVYAAEAVEEVAIPTFDHQRGFYDAPFALSLATATDGATIRYTLDGSAPTESHGTLYDGTPIQITTTAIVRAVAYKPDAITSQTIAHSYIYLADVIKQGKTIDGQPNPLLPLFGGTREFDYEMDPAIIDSATYKDRIIPALLSIPTMSIAASPDDMWGTGFYDTKDVEVGMSMEYIDPNDPTQVIQANAEIEAHGDNGHKRSLRVTFKKEYGPGKLDFNFFKNAPANSDSASNEIDQFVLRAGSNRSWTNTTYHKYTTFTEDEFGRGTQLALSGDGLHGSFVHLYLNGVYFGLYNLVERPNDGFGEIYYGGKDDDWFAIADNDVKSGDSSRWSYLLKTVAPKDMSIASNYQELTEYLDVENFADYLIEQFYHRVIDWPVKNWWAGADTKTNMPIKFFAWDTEYQFNHVAGGTPAGAWVYPDFLPGATANANSPLVKLWRSAVKSPEFMQLFADRVAKAVAGPLKDATVLARLDALNDYISEAVIAESARWGDLAMPNGQARKTRDVHWVQAVGYQRAMIPGNADKLVAALRAAGYFSSLDAATLDVPPGLVDIGTVVHVTNPNPSGTIYYTLDGTDPRLPGGGLNPSALVYDPSAGITLNNAASLFIRIQSGSTWSGATQAAYSVNAIEQLRVSELYYHPKAPDGSAIDKDEYEFLELINTSPITLNLEGVQLTNGVTFTFPDIDLAPGERIVVVRNLEAFQSVYGTSIRVAGVYSGKLDNSGERVTITAPGGVVLADFTYDDDWYKTTDGDGYSLVVIDPTADPSTLNTPQAWQAGAVIGGTPGSDNPLGNQAPKPNAGAQQSITIGNDASLAGSVTDDGLPSGSSVSVEWSLVSGPGDVTFADSTSLATTASFSAIGEYILKLTATDGEFTAESTVKIIVNAPIIPATISGIAFDDGDKNGSYEPTDTLAAGATIYLDTNNNGSLDSGETSVVTDENGVFTFTDLQPGTYRVRRVIDSGFEYSTPLLNITVASGDSLSGYAIGIKAVPPPPAFATITGRTYNDNNANGVFDSGDSPISRVVFLDANNNGKLDTGETSLTSQSDGAFSFGNLSPGVYHVRRVFPAGYKPSNPLRDYTLVGGEAITGADIGSVTSGTVVTPPGENPPPVVYGSISGVLFNDNNANGAFDAGDSPISRVVYLDLNGNSKRDAGEPSTTSASNGKFTFANLLAGQYSVRREFPAGFKASNPPRDYTLAAGQNVTGADIGSVTTGTVVTPPGDNPPPGDPKTASISGFLFWDADRDAKFDSGETYQTGKTVFIDLDDDNILDSNETKLTTDSQGRFTFSGLSAGTYIVKRVVPKGYLVTTPKQTVTLTAGQVFSGVAIGTNTI